jgi:hypothetical protein
MVYFQTKNPILGKFWRALEWQIWYILWPFGIYYCRFGNLVVYFSPFWYIGVFFVKKNLAPLVVAVAKPEEVKKIPTFSNEFLSQHHYLCMVLRSSVDIQLTDRRNVDKMTEKIESPRPSR